MNDDWPEDLPRDYPEAEAMSEVIAWTPDGHPRQSLPRHLPRPKTVIVTDRNLFIDGWVILMRFDVQWMQWMLHSVSEWSKDPCDEESRQQMLGIIEAIEAIFLRSHSIRGDSHGRTDASEH